jgi:Ni/Co efflux regulator RcnB
VTVFNIEPDRPTQPGREPRRMPLAQPPAAPKSWWGTVPGQFALIAILGGVIVLVLGLAGVVGPLSLR